jgi:hypothetical protein
MSDGLLGFGTTFALAFVSAWVFLALRCHRAGRLFGPSCRWWSLGVIGLTSIASTAIAFVGVAIADVLPPVVLGVAVPSTLYLSQVERPRPEHRHRPLVEVPTVWLTLLLERLDQAMADARLTWCEDRVDQMWRLDQLLGAARHYHAALKERLPPEERRKLRIDARLKAIEDRLEVVRIIDNGASAAKVKTAMNASRATREKRYERYRNELGRLAQLLRHHAEQDLIRLLGEAYKFRFYRLKVYTGYTEPSTTALGSHP